MTFTVGGTTTEEPIEELAVEPTGLLPEEVALCGAGGVVDGVTTTVTIEVVMFATGGVTSVVTAVGPTGMLLEEVPLLYGEGRAVVGGW